jgi:signal transduction histidine kinase
LNVNELSFVNRLNMLFIYSGISSLAFALLVGIYMARKISAPISRVIKNAGMISNGYYKDRISEKSRTSEISELSDSINNLAGSLEQQQEIRKRMTSDVAHELRTPLSTLQSHLEAMIDGVWEPSVDRIKVCHEEILRINRMVGDLEKLERYENEKIELNISGFDLAENAKNVTANFENDFYNKKIKVTIKLQPIAVRADNDKIRQVMVNLISNAIKYTPEGGKIWIETYKEDAMAVFLIRDNGIGIAEDDIPYIFERLYRTDKSRNSETGGAGIGLTITKAIVEAHKGSIEVKSELNKGTAFTVKIPLADPLPQ